MFCPKCGSSNPDTSTFCSSCGNALKAEGASSQPAAQKMPYESFLATSPEYLKGMKLIHYLDIVAAIWLILCLVGVGIGFYLWEFKVIFASFAAIILLIPFAAVVMSKKTKLEQIKAPQLYQKYLSE